MKKFIIICAILFPVKEAFCEDLNTCRMYFENQQFALAANCYVPYVNKNPNIPEYRMLYTLSLYNNKNFAGAFKQCNISKQYFPNTKVYYAADELGIKAQARLKEINSAQYYDNGNYFSQITQYSKWSKMPISYWIQNGAYENTVNSSFLEWQRKLSPELTFARTYKEQDADIKVYFSSSFPCKGESTVGCTALTKTGKDNQSASIYINPTFKTNANQGAIKIKHVSMHEIGHALGLGGHSNNRNDVMYPSTDTNKNAVLSNRDVQTVKYLYNFAK